MRAEVLHGGRDEPATSKYSTVNTGTSSGVPEVRVSARGWIKLPIPNNGVGRRVRWEPDGPLRVWVANDTVLL